MSGRTFTREFKLELMRQLANGTTQPAQVCREHLLHASLLSRWRKEYCERGEDAFLRHVTAVDTTSTKSLLEARVAELERSAGLLALENQVLKKALQHISSTAPTPPGSNAL